MLGAFRGEIQKIYNFKNKTRDFKMWSEGLMKGEIGILLSQGPHVDFLCDNTPVCMVVVGADNVKVFHIFLNDVVDLSLPEHVVVSVVSQRPSGLCRVFRVAGTEGVLHVGCGVPEEFLLH